MKSYSEKAERAMKTASTIEGVPTDLHEGIMRAVRSARHAENASSHARRWLLLSAAAAACLVVAGVWWSSGPSGWRHAGKPAQPLKPVSSFSDLNPVVLIPAGTIQAEWPVMEEDLRRAAIYLIAQVEDRAGSLL